MALQDELRTAINKILPDVSCVIGWGRGADALHSAPLFINKAEDTEKFEQGFLYTNNPALFLPELKGQKVGVVVRGCDARSVGQQIAEGLIKREDVVLVGFACEGMVDLQKVSAQLLGKVEMETVKSVQDNGMEIVLTFEGQEFCFAKESVLAEKCKRCLYPNAHIADVFVGERKEPAVSEDTYADLEEFEKLSLAERQAFWEKEMERCIRCYACRNACPLCVCRDHCIASSREPKWITQADSVRDKLFFQVIHATHLAGRCTGCGECERACPVGIPVLLLKRSLSRSVEKFFAYQAGIDEGTPPLLTFSLEEPRIKERNW